VTLKDESESDDILFDKKNLFKITIEPSISALEFKQKVLD
jgi:hypothetical protein